MAVRKILYANDPRLRQKAKKVTKFGPDLKRLADDMLETMREAQGVGIAGPQIGVMDRIFVAEIPADADDPDCGKSFVFVNPEITRYSEEVEEGREGCLSIPNWFGLVDRSTEIEIKAKTVNGKNIRLPLSGYLARVCQHELDHLNGILFIDHIKEKDKLWQGVPGEEMEEDAEPANDTTDDVSVNAVS